MKSILLSIKPKWVAKILNGDKTIEIRKKFPKDYRGWVYIYCTKDNYQLVKPKDYDEYVLFTKGAVDYTHEHSLNGKVVARFWCDFTFKTCIEIAKIADEYEQLLKDSCLTKEELEKYVGKNFFYAIHISKIVIFDKPKELSDFMPIKWNKCGVKDKNGLYQCHKCPYGEVLPYGGECHYKPLTKAPQNFMFIESEDQK